ncbi:MAG: carbonic anhydrase [Bradyrhizobium sp.]|nr:MAG: carbonic anhydrase [Bradyrhizobium sp.]
MDTLLEGYRRFRAEVWPAERARYEALARWGQNPETMVIACADSRVDPQTVFGAVPGEIFVARNIGGLVPPYQPDQHYHGTSAAIEFGVRVLKVKRLVVLGHGQCGAVRAMRYGAPPEARDFVATWVEVARPAFAVEGGDENSQLAAMEAAVVRLSLANLMGFPWVKERVESGELKLLGFRFDIHTGELEEVDADGVRPVR